MKSLRPFRLAGVLLNPRTLPQFAIPTHLTDREKVKLMRLAAGVERDAGRDVTAVEIGAYLGASSTFLASGLRRRGSRVLSVDTWANDAMTEGPQDTMEAFRRNTARFGERIVPVRGWSDEPATVAAVAARAGRIDLLFIDGDHSYDGVLKDWSSYSPLLADGATVVMHDHGWADGVRRVVSELIAPRTERQGSLPNLWWGRLRR